METLDTLRGILATRRIKYRTRQTRFGETVTIPTTPVDAWWVFPVSGGFGVTSNTDDPNIYIGPFATVGEALAWVKL